MYYVFSYQANGTEIKTPDSFPSAKAASIEALDEPGSDSSVLLDTSLMASLKKRRSLDVPRLLVASEEQKVTSPLKSPIRCAISPVRPVTLNSFHVRPDVDKDSSSHTLPRATRRNRPSQGNVSPGLHSIYQRHFKAVKKYDPEYFSSSGHREGELALQEGDLVQQLGKLGCL